MFRTQSKVMLTAMLLGVGLVGSVICPVPASAGILDEILQPRYGVPYYGQSYRAPYVAYGNHYGNRYRTMLVPAVSSRYGHPCQVSYYNRAPRGRALGYYNGYDSGNFNNQWGYGRSNRSHHHHY